MRALVGAALVIALAACAGPKPVVESVAASDVTDHKTTVSVVVRNSSSGEGQVSIVVTVRDRVSGEVVGRDERSVELRARERIQIALELDLPPGIETVSADAEARYPPE